MKPRSAERFTASSTESSGARPAAGRRPASASRTEGERVAPPPGGCFYTLLNQKHFFFVLFLPFARSIVFELECVL